MTGSTRAAPSALRPKLKVTLCPESVVFRVGATENPASWQAPASAAAVKNPYSVDEMSRTQGRELFVQQCVTCHGASGKGDGPASAFLGKPLPDFTKEKFQKQTEGELFWKVSNGNAPMPTFGEALEDKQLWEVVNYLRNFAK